MKITKRRRDGVVQRYNVNPGKKASRSNSDLYLNVKQATQKEFDDFPIRFAFNDKQLRDGLRELGISASEAVNIGAGGFIRKQDKDRFLAMMKRHNELHERMLKNKDYVYQMFLYELANHEYGITMSYDDTLRSVGLSMKEVRSNPMLKEQLERATKDFMGRSR